MPMDREAARSKPDLPQSLERLWKESFQILLRAGVRLETEGAL